MADNSHITDDLMEGLREELLDEAADSLKLLVLDLDLARQGKKDHGEVLDAIRRLAVFLKGQGATVGARLVTSVAHRLEDFLSKVSTVTAQNAVHIDAFLNALTDIAEGTIPLDADASEVVRTLPAKPSDFSESEVEVRNIEVMLVMVGSTATHFVEREMQQCGYRIINVESTFEALPMIIRTKPDMVVISAIMPELGGIDLAIALSNMPATRNIPIALITSLDSDDESLKLLPPNVPIIKKGPSFGDDLVEALSDAFLI